MTASGHEQRREARRPGHGRVQIQWSGPKPMDITGRLVDVSDNGFRMAHHCAALMSGQVVEFSHVEAKGQARVVWTRILAQEVETGFVVVR
jgi:hypothetical protein